MDIMCRRGEIKETVNFTSNFIFNACNLKR